MFSFVLFGGRFLCFCEGFIVFVGGLFVFVGGSLLVGTLVGEYRLTLFLCSMVV